MATKKNTTNVESRITLVKESKKVGSWIDRWAKKNPYKDISLSDHNRKFKKDMNAFLSKSKFSPFTKRMFKQN